MDLMIYGWCLFHCVAYVNFSRTRHSRTAHLATILIIHFDLILICSAKTSSCLLSYSQLLKCENLLLYISYIFNNSVLLLFRLDKTKQCKSVTLGSGFLWQHFSLFSEVLEKKAVSRKNNSCSPIAYKTSPWTNYNCTILLLRQQM